MDVKLDLLNAMLAAIGSSGITSTVGRHPGLIRSAPILERVNRTVQVRGHWFNTDRGLKLLPTAAKEYVLPQATLKADTTNQHEPYVRRGRRMYDPTKHTYAIDIPQMLVDVVVQLDYDDLPITAQDYIRALAVQELVLSSDADQITLRARAADVNTTQLAFERERTAQSDVSLRNNPSYARIMSNMGGLRHMTAQHIGGR